MCIQKKRPRELMTKAFAIRCSQGHCGVPQPGEGLCWEGWRQGTEALPLRRMRVSVCLMWLRNAGVEGRGVLGYLKLIG